MILRDIVKERLEHLFGLDWIMSDLYHRAARDSNIPVLNETTRKDCNAKDEDGRTPTHLAAFEGHLEALRVLVSRGGNPDKCDRFGNTALHFAAAKGHIKCVSFLVNFGVNIYSMDIDKHTPKDLAVMNDNTDILRYLDEVAAKEEQRNPSQVKKMKDAAEKRNAKVLKEYSNYLAKADSNVSHSQKDFESDFEKMAINNRNIGHRSSVTQLTKFSEMVGSGTSGTVGKTNPGNMKVFGTVFKKMAPRRTSQVSIQDHFKIRAKEADGKMTVKKIEGLRRGSEILFTSPAHVADDDAGSKDSFDPRFLGSGFGPGQNETRQSIFERPGLGNLAFRKSMTASLYSFSNQAENQDESIGSAGSLTRRSQDGFNEDENDDEVDTNPQISASLALFLAGIGMKDYISSFSRERITMDSLMLLNDEDLKEMGLPTGPRKTILKAISERQADLKRDDAIEDTNL